MPGRGAAPGANSRGRGGKFKKFTRGGGHHFSKDLRPLDADGNEVSMWSETAKRGDDDSEEGSEEDSEEGSDDDSDAGPSQPQQEMTREERKAAKKAQKDAAIAKRQGGQVQVGDLPSDSEEEDDDTIANPNHSKAARKQAIAEPSDVDGAAEGVNDMSINKPTMSRREREALEKRQAAERYRKLHAEGKTDEAKADLARLKLIREKREADAARKQAEKEEKDEQEKERRLEREAKEAKRREAALGKSAKKGKK